jgi:hypothetical protein
MVASVGSSGAAGFGASGAGTEAQLAAYKKELASCVTCESAGTTSGKQAIQEAEVKVQSAEAEIAKLAAAKPDEKRDTSSSTAEDKPDPNPVVYTVENKGGKERAGLDAKPESPLGLVVNLYA